MKLVTFFYNDSQLWLSLSQSLSTKKITKHILHIVHALSRQDDTATSLSATTNLITWQQWKQLYPVCVCLCLCRHIQTPNSLHSEHKQDDPCQLPIYNHFLFLYFYSVLLFHTVVFLKQQWRKWSWQLCFFSSFNCWLKHWTVVSDVETLAVNKL